MRDPQVIILEKDNRFSVNDAENFGTVTYLFDKESYKCKPFNTEQFREDILNRLDEVGFDANIDYVTLTGSHLNVSLFTFFLGQEYDTIQFLLFNAVNNKYEARRPIYRDEPA